MTQPMACPECGRPVVCAHCGCEITEKCRRSSRANRYWWGVVVKTFQEIWSKGRVQLGLPPYTKEQVHYTLVEVTAGTELGPMGRDVPVPTKVMDSKEFWQLTEDARALAWDEYQVRIPEPNEPWEDAA